MSLDAFFNVFPIAAAFGFGLMAVVRGAMLRRRNVRVIVADSARSFDEMAHEALMLAALVALFYLIIDYADPPGPRWLPQWLDRQLIQNRALHWLGVAMLATSVTLYALALAAMGDAWRIGIDHSSTTASVGLVTHGVFARSRNPIYVAMDLLALGAFAVHGRVVQLVVAVALMILLHVQILREERFLAARYGEEFHQYAHRVGRYAPWR
jgi:protein-S-isoprenylcysteine O-methyltransferase Ste14